MTSSLPPPTAPADRIPAIQKIAYGLGAVVTIVAVNSVVQLTGLFYVVGLGISVISISTAQAFPRFWDALVDPFIGNLSDNFRSRIGRRIPFLIAGGVLIGIAFWLLWTVPRSWSQSAMFAYFVATSFFFYTVVPVYAIPHGALGLEMTSDYHEKTSLFAYASFIGNIGAIALPWVYYLANRPFFHGDSVKGITWVCLGMSVMLTACALTCAFVCRETRREQTRHQEKFPILASFATTYRNPTFVRLVLAFVLLIVGFQLVMGFNNYISIFYLFGGDKDGASGLMAINGTLWAAVGLAGVLPTTWYSRRFGKRAAVITALGIITVANLAKILCYNPAHPWLTIFPTIGISLGMVCCFTLVNSMIADICDADEDVSGVRREGIYFAVYNWWWKVAVSLATVISGLILRYTGFQEGLNTQTVPTLFWIRCWEIGLPPVLCVMSIVLLLRYPLTAEQVNAIKQRLAARHPAPAPDAAPASS